MDHLMGAWVNICLSTICMLSAWWFHTGLREVLAAAQWQCEAPEIYTGDEMIGIGKDIE